MFGSVLVRHSAPRFHVSYPHMPVWYFGPFSPSAFLSVLMLMRRVTPAAPRVHPPSFATPRLHETRHLATRETPTISVQKTLMR
eukprot:2840738-Prymnesium_polylepis.1